MTETEYSESCFSAVVLPTFLLAVMILFIFFTMAEMAEKYCWDYDRFSVEYQKCLEHNKTTNTEL